MHKILYSLLYTVKSGKNNLFALGEIALYLYPIMQSDTFCNTTELRNHSV